MVLSAEKLSESEVKTQNAVPGEIPVHAFLTPEAHGKLAAAVLEAGVSPHDVQLVLHADLGTDGNYLERLLVVSNDTLLVFLDLINQKNSSGNPYKQEINIPLNEIHAIKSISLVGGGALEITRTGNSQHTREILRYSTTWEKVFSSITQRLKARMKCAQKFKKEAEDKAKELTKNDAVELKPKEESKFDKPPLSEDLEDPRNPLTFEDILVKEREKICGSCGGPLQDGTRVCPACVSKGRTLIRILKFAKPFKGSLALLMALMLVGVVISLVPPLLTKVLVDSVLQTGTHLEWIPWLVLGLAGTMISSTLLNIARTRISVRVGAKITQHIRELAFHHLQLLSLSYYNRQKTGQLMSRISSDTGRLQGFLVNGIQFTIVNTLQAIGISAVLIYINPFLGLLVLLPAPFVFLLSRYIWKHILARFRKEWEAHGRLTTLLNDVLNGIRVVKAFGKEKQEMGRFDQKSGALADSIIHAEQYWGTWIPILTLTMAMGQVLVWYFGSLMVVEAGNKFTIGDLIAYLAYLSMLYGPMMLLTRLNEWIARAMTSAERVFEILDATPEIAESANAVAMPDMKGHVAFKRIRFGYEKHKPVLEDVDLDVQAGEMIGLVGHSGAGKSTTINLLSRLYDVDDGSIEIDGVNIKDIRQEDLRANVGVVLQETFLFSGSILENITYGEADPSGEQVIRAAYAANGHDFIIKKPDAYDTEVGERGGKLSGGEKQRISIARAILHDPRILILDEATSSVDTETEKKIQEAIKFLIKGRTTFAIAHRLSTLRDAHRLVVLDEGKVKEVGTHAELMKIEKGTYRKLVDIQTGMNEIIAYKG